MTDCFAIVSYTTKEAVEHAEQLNRRKDTKWLAEPQPEISYLTCANTMWRLRDVIWDWLEKLVLESDVDPWDVTVLSCTVTWDPEEMYDCGSHTHDEDDDDYDLHLSEHRYCGTTGVDRYEYVAEMVSYNEEYLGGIDSYEAARRLAWVVSEILGCEDAYPGVDYDNIRHGPFPVWEASLYGGVLIKEAS